MFKHYAWKHMLPHPRRVALALGVILSGFIFASGAWGSTEGAFAAADFDARGLAMGGACLSLARGDAAVFWNPARLPYLPARSATASYGELIEDLPSGLTTVSLAIPWGHSPEAGIPYDRGDRWAAGACLSRLGLDEIAGTAAWTETALSAAIARTFVGYVSAGVSIRYLDVGSDIEEGNAHGVSADLAFSLDTTDRTRVAVVVRNVIGELSWESGRSESLPISAAFGFSFEHSRWASAELALNVDGDGLATTSVGLEIAPAAAGLIFWGGLKRHETTSPRNIPSFGVALPAGGLVISYGASFDEDRAFGTVQRFSVSTTF